MAHDIDWRGGVSAKDENLARRSNRWLATLVALALLGVLLWYLVELFLTRSDETFIVAMPVVGSDRLTLPPVEFQQETLADLQALPDYLDTFELETASSVSGLAERLEGWMRQREPAAGGDRRVLLLYISAHGVVLDGKPYLLCGDFTLHGEAGRCSLETLLDAVDAVDAKVKLLVFDTGRIVTDPRLGVLANDFPRLAAEAVAARDSKNLYVLCGTVSAEKALVDYQQERSLFGSAMGQALTGYADLAEHGGDGDGKVSLRELYLFVLRSCQGRSMHPGGRQTPVLAQAGSRVVAPADVSEIELVNLPSGWRAEAEPSSAEEEPSKIAGKTSEVAGAAKQIGTVVAPGATSKASSAVSSAKNTKNEADKVSKAAEAVSQAAEADAADEETAAAPAEVAAPQRPPVYARLDHAWQLRDRLTQPTDGTWSPVMYAPQLWRAADAWLTDLEHRLRAGSAYQQQELLLELEALISRLEELEAAIGGGPSPPRRSNASVGDRLINAWLNFQADPSSRDGYQASAIAAQAAAMRTYQQALYRLPDYVRWHDRAALISDTRLPEFSAIEALIRQLEAFAASVTGSPPPSGDVLVQAAEALQNVASGLDRRLQSRAADVVRTISDPLSQRRAEDLLAAPLLPAATRLELLDALAGLSADDPAQSQPGTATVPDWVATTPNLALTSTQLSQLHDVLGLQAALLRLADPEAAVPLERLLRQLEGQVDYNDAVGSRLHELGGLFQERYQMLCQRVQVDREQDRDRRVSAAYRHVLRLVDARDVEMLPRRPWDILPAVPRLPAEIVADAARLEVAQLEPVRLDLVEWRDLPLQVRASGARGSDLVAQLQFDAQAVEVRAAPSNRLIDSGGSVSSLLRPDQTTTFTLQARAKQTRSDQRSQAPLQVAVTDGAKLRQETRVEFILPPPNDVELIVRREGVDYSQGDLANEDDKIRVRPFPNRATTYEFALRNRSERARTVKVELLALPRLRTATWSTGRVYQVDELERLLFDPGSGRVRSNVQVVSTLEEMELPADPEKWVPIEFGKKKAAPPPAEGEAPPTAPPPTEPPEAAPKIDITHGLVCRISDPATDKVWLKWIEVFPKSPQDYLNASARFDVVDERIYVEIQPLPGRPLHETLPQGIAAKPMDIRLHTDAAERNDFAQLSLDAPQVALWAKVPTQNTYYVGVDVDGWPRAFGFRVDASRTRDTIGVPERRNLERVQLTHLGVVGDPTTYVTSPQFASPATPAVPPAEGTPPPQPPLLLPSDGVARFLDRRGAARLLVKFQVDAPDNRFVRGAGEDQIVLWRESDNRRWEFYSDRQIQTWATPLPNGWLSLESSVDDYSVELASDGSTNVVYRVHVDLNLNGRAVASDNVAVLLDNEPPQIKITSTPPARTRVPAGQPIRVNLEVVDASQVARVQYAFDPNGRMEQPQELAGAQIFQNEELARLVFTIDTAERKAGPWVLVGKVFDGVGNAADLPPLTFEITAPKPEMAAELEIRGVIYLGSSDNVVDGARVVLMQGMDEIAATMSDGRGAFHFKNVKEGSYDVVATKRHRGFNYEGKLPVTAAPVPAAPVTLNIVK